jgi:hypothetical protein
MIPFIGKNCQFGGLCLGETGVGVRDRLDGVHNLDAGQLTHEIPPFVQIQIDTGSTSLVRRQQWLGAPGAATGPIAST